MSLKFDNKTYSDSTLSCSEYDYYDFDYYDADFNDDGPVFGPNGEWELDPDNDLCNFPRPVFATCKNNCPGGELCYQLSVLSYFVIIKYKHQQTYCMFLFIGENIFSAANE